MIEKPGVIFVRSAALPLFRSAYPVALKAVNPGVRWLGVGIYRSIIFPDQLAPDKIVDGQQHCVT